MSEILKKIQGLLDNKNEVSVEELNEAAGAARDELGGLNFKRGQHISTLNRLAIDGGSDADIRTAADELARVCGDLWRLQSVLPKLEAKIAGTRGL